MMKDIVYKYKKEIISALFMMLIPILIFDVVSKRNMKEIALQKFEREIETHKPNSYDGSGLVTACYPMLNDVAIIGDSYSYFLGYYVGLDLSVFCLSGLTLNELADVFDAAIATKKKYAVIFIGPNDFRCKTSINDFRENLNKYIEKIKEKMNAKVILTTYMKTVFTEDLENKNEGYIPIKEYNDVILDLIDEKNGVYYLDISMLDNFTEYGRWKEDSSDVLHFNAKFNIAYINKLYNLLVRIRREEIGKM